MSGGNMLDHTKIVLKSLVLSSPEPRTVDQLARDYQSQEGKPIPVQLLGHTNLKTFLLSMPDLLAYDSVNRTFTLAEKAAGNSEHIHKLVSGQKPKNRSRAANHSNRSNKANHRYNNTDRTQQIWDTHPMSYNQTNYNTNVYPGNSHSQQNCYTNAYPANHQPIFEPGKLLDRPNYINSLLGPCPGMALIPTSVIPCTTNISRCYETRNTSGIPQLMSINVKPQGLKNFNKPKNETTKKKSYLSPLAAEPTDSEKQNDISETLNGKQSDSSSEEITALPPMDDDDPIRHIGIKMMSSKYGRSIPQAIMPKTSETGHIHRICVTEVTRFPHFYFQFADTEDIMLGLQDDLSFRYEHSEIIRLSEIQIGNACSAWYANKWSRAEILSRPDDSYLVRLLFVDYGTIDYVSIDDIRYLAKEICEYPRLCHRGALAFLEPSRNDQIEKEIVREFCKMVTEKSLIAVFSNVDEGDDISMTLIDTNDEKVDFILNKILMNSLQEMEHKSNEELDVLK